MANLNFPSNPSTGTVYTIGTRSWVWNGYGWQLQTGVSSFDPLTANRVIVTTSTNSTSTNTGGLIVYGGAGINLDLTVGGLIRALNTAVSTGTNSGAVTVVGGLGVGGSIYGGQVYDNGSRVVTQATLGNYGVTQLNAGEDLSVSTTTGIVTVTNISSLQSVTSRGSSTNQVIRITNPTQSWSTDTGALVVTGGIGIGGAITVKTTATIENIIGGDGYIRDLGVSTFIASAIITSTNVLNATSATDGAVRIAGGVGIAQDLYVGGNINAAVLTATSGVFTSATISDLTVTNSLVVSSTSTVSVTTVGGVSVGGDLYAGGLYDGQRRVVTNVEPNAGPYIGISGLYSSGTTASFVITNLGVQTLTAGTDTAVNNSTGTITIWSTATLQSITERSTTTDVALLFSNLTNASSTTTGALVISGGLGVGKSIYASEIYDANSRVVTQATLGNYGVSLLTAGTDTAVSTSTGPVVIWNTSTLQSVTNRGFTTTNAINITNTLESNTYTQGALTVAGGVGIAKNLAVGGSAAIYGNLQVYGTWTYVNSTQTYITDPLIELGGGIDNTTLVTNDGVDRGILFHYNTSLTPNVGASSNAFFGLDNATQTLIFKTGFAGGGNAVGITSFTNQGNWGDAKLGTLRLESTASSTDLYTGALVVKGGVAVQQDFNLSGNIAMGKQIRMVGDAPFIEINDTGTTALIPGTQRPTINFVFKDSSNVTRFRILTTGSNTAFLTDETPRVILTSATTYIANTSQSISTNTGALVVTGGAGIKGDLYAMNMYSNGSQVITQGSLASQGVTALTAGTDTAVSTQTGLVTVWNISTLGTVTGRGNTTTSNVFFGANIESTASNTGSVVVVGGMGVTGNIYAGAVYDADSRVITEDTIVLNAVTKIDPGEDISVNTNTGIIVISGTGTFQTVTARGSSTNVAIRILNTSVSTSSVNGALVVAGGVGIRETLNVGSYINIGYGVNETSNRSTLNVYNTSSYAFVQSWYGAGGVFDLTYTSGSWRFGSSSNEAMYIGANNPMYIKGGVSSNWIGINTSTPSVWLDVAGDIKGYNIYSNEALVLTTATIGSYGVSKITTGSGILVTPPEGVGIVNIESIDTLQLVTDRGQATTNAISINSFVTATSTTTGALKVVGGVGIQGDIFVGKTATVASLVSGPIVASGVAQFTNTTPSTNSTSGAVIVSGGMGVAGSIYAGTAIFDQGRRVISTVQPTAGAGIQLSGVSTVGPTATFVVTNIGVISLTAGTDTVITTSTGNVNIWNNSTLQSITSRGSNTNVVVTFSNGADTNTSTQGSVVVTGGVGITKNLIVGGNAAVYGNLQVFGTQTFVESTQTYVVDPLIELGGAPGNSSLAVNDGFDRGLVLHYSTTASSNTTYDNHAFLGLDNASKELHFKTNVYPGGTQSYTPSFINTGTYGRARFGALTLMGGVDATSTTTGDLVVTGGMGIGGAVYIGGALYLNGAAVITTGTSGGAGVGAIYAGTDTAVSANSGAVTVWNTSTLQSVTSRGSQTDVVVTFSNPTPSSTSTNGAVVISGGLGVNRAIYAGEDLYAGGKLWANTGAFVRSVIELRDVTTSTIQIAKIASSGTSAIFDLGRNDQSTQPAIDFHSSANAVDYDTRIMSSGGTASEGNGNLNLYAAGVFVQGTVGSNSTATGAFQVKGGVGVGENIYAGGRIIAQGTTAATSAASGALQSAGGAGIAGDLYVGGNSVIGANGTNRGNTGAKIFANGSFATNGDAQAGIYVLRRSVTTALLTALTTNGASSAITNQVALPDNSTYTFKILITARSTTSNDEGAWEFQGVISRYTGVSSTIMRVVNKSKIYSSVSTWDCDVSADTGTGTISVKAKGDGANTVRFVARVDTAEVTN